MTERAFFDPVGDAARFLSTIAGASENAIIGKTLDGIIVAWNPGAERLYGYADSEVRGRSIALTFAGEDAGELERIMARVRAGQPVDYHETVRRTKSGQLINVWLTVAPVFGADGKPIGAATLARNITADRRAELALNTSERRWRAIVESAVDGIVVIDGRGLIEAFNPAAERLFGYAEAELLGRNVSVLMPSPYREAHDGYLARYLQTGTAKIIGRGREVSGTRKDGTTFPLHLSVGQLPVGDDHKFIGILHDLTARVALEERIRASEAQWRSIVESAVDGIVVINAVGQIDAFNPAAERLFDYAESDVLGKNVSMLMPSPHREQHDAYLGRYLATGEASIIGKGRQVAGMRRDGTVFPIHLAVGEMRLAGQRKFTGIIHDLTARVRMEEQLREQASMVRLGEMAALVAHEVKNPLAGIRGAVQVIGSRLPAGSRDAAITQEIVSRIDGLNDLMKDLLLYARPPQPRPQVIEIGDLLEATATLLGQDPDAAGVKVEMTGKGQVAADPDLLRIVFTNVLTNAAHAMKGAGTVRVSVDRAAGQCRMVFADDGPGIPPEVRECIFVPFFTTKSRGTGLGLPTARRLIEAHGGTIEVSCPASGGTTVTVALPS